MFSPAPNCPAFNPSRFLLARWSIFAILISIIVTSASAKEAISSSQAGVAVGLVNTGLFLGTAIVQPLFGWVGDGSRLEWRTA